MFSRSLALALASAVLAGCNCNPGPPPPDGGMACTSALTCPATNNECLERTCLNGVCGTRPVLVGTVVSAQVPGDCKRSQCDESGHVVTVDDATDVKSDDNDCTLDTCMGGNVVHTTLDAGVRCGADGGLVCSPAGTCVGCNAPADCGQDGECASKTCTAGACGTSFTTMGTPTAQQAAGDCKQRQCDGQGAAVTVALASDVPVDGNACTDDVCTGMSPSNPPTSAGSTCADGGVVCDGAGACVACNQASDCPGSDTFCRARTCTNHACGFANTAMGTALPTQAPRDCRRVVCDGAGGTTNAVDDTDVPVDNNACTDDVCTNGTPSNPLRSAGASCGMNLVCDAMGNCVGCRTAADCPGTNTECRTITCTNNACGATFAPANTPLSMQTAGDCRRAVCDGAGNNSSIADNADVPVDNNQCTSDVCTAGVPSNPPLMAGATCAQNGGTRCNGAGACVECLMASQCGSSTECQAFTCPAGRCLVSNQPNGTPLGMQVTGDCKTAVCDGDGGVGSTVTNGDVPVDNNQCTGDVCTAGAPSNPPLDAGTTCTQGGGALCNGAGACVGCLTAADCGASTECRTYACTMGACSSVNAPANTVLVAQTAGDCKRAQCDGMGGIVNVPQDSDVPVDGNQCTSDVCTAGTPSNPNLPADAMCNQGGGTRCDGNGACVQCYLSSHCGTNTECLAYTCTMGVCGSTFTPANTPLGMQVAGDCRTAVCNGGGGTSTITNDADVPVDGNQCTDDVCSMGTPSNPPRAARTACTQSGGSLCDGAGACVQCLAASDCPGMDTECQARSCASGACGFTFTAAGTALVAQTAGDCRTAQCNGSGGTTQAVNDADVPVDGNQCTNDVCSMGTPSNPPVALGASCSQSGGIKCNGAGVCVACVAGSDCPSGVCSSWVCQAPTCSDGVRNGTETDVDCGGGVCGPCAPTKACGSAADCQSGICTGSICQSPSVASTTPADGAMGVLVPTNVAVTFAGPMSPASLSTQAVGGPCTGALQVSADNFVTCVGLSPVVMSGGNTVATVTPTVALDFNTTFRVRVTTAATDPSGNPLAAAFTTPNGFRTASQALSCVVVISQVYGGGGNTGAPYLNDFIELRNLGTQPVNLGTWSVQYASSAGTTWTRTNLTGTVQPGAYFLVQQASSGAVGVALPTPDATGTTNLSGTAGKVALVSNQTTLTGGCPTGGGIVDFVGFGSGANCFEGTGPTPAPSNSTSVSRLSLGCVDTNRNAVDFTAGAPTPRNTATMTTACLACGVQNETNVALEADYCNLQFPGTLTVAAGTSTGNIYGQLYEAGLTEPAGAPANVRVQLGWAPAGVNPLTQSGWQWVNATWNVQVGNNDEYVASFTAPATGSYVYTFRFSLDNGATWTYGDLDGAGSNVGLTFDMAQLGVLTVP